MDKYWEKRELERLKLIDGKIDKLVDNLKANMLQASKNIENEIMHLYIKYAEDNKLSYTKTLEYLTNDERAEFQKDLKYYIDTYKDPEKALIYRKELQALSTRARVKRLDTLKAAILKEASNLHKFLSDDTYKTMQDILNESYLFKSFSLHQAQVMVKFDLLPKNTLQTLLNHPWSGSNYSSKIWDKTNNFTQKIDKVMTAGLVQGKSIDQLVFDLRNAVVAKPGKTSQTYYYERLVRTECSYVAEQAAMESYKKNNIEKYEYVATLDTRTSDKCIDLDGIVFEVAKAVIGVNYPPAHSFCRSTTVPHIVWDGEYNDGVRIARVPDKEYNEIIKDMPYKEWKRKYFKV